VHRSVLRSRPREPVFDSSRDHSFQRWTHLPPSPSERSIVTERPGEGSDCARGHTQTGFFGVWAATFDP